MPLILQTPGGHFGSKVTFWSKPWPKATLNRGTELIVQNDFKNQNPIRWGALNVTEFPLSMYYDEKIQSSLEMQSE